MKISVITASYNYEEYIKDTIQSVLNQTYKDWELIIVDDCSSDNSVNIIKSFSDERIKLFINEKNQGLKESLLRGLKEATGEWVAFLESDDLFREDYLEKKLEVIKKYPDVAVIFNDVELFGDEKRIKNMKKSLNKYVKDTKNKLYPCNLFKEISFFNRVLTFSATTINKQKLLETSFDTPIDKLLDWWLLIHLSYKYDFYYIPEKLTKWRLHENSYISKKNKCCKIPINIISLIDILKNNFNLSIIFITIKVTIYLTFKYFKYHFMTKLKKLFKIPLKPETNN